MTEENASRLYLLLPPRFEPAAMAAQLGAILAAVPIACVRVDLGPAPETDWTTALNHLIEPCHAADVALVVTDHYRLVEPLGLDGVHLDSARTPLREVRKSLGDDRIVGAHAGASRHQGMTLGEAGADYVSFGPVGDTGALGDDTQAPGKLFEWWAEMFETPCVAEGGVTLQHAEQLRDTADFLVPDLGIWREPDDVAATLAKYAALLD